MKWVQMDENGWKFTDMNKSVWKGMTAYKDLLWWMKMDKNGWNWFKLLWATLYFLGDKNLAIVLANRRRHLCWALQSLYQIAEIYHGSFEVFEWLWFKLI